MPCAVAVAVCHGCGGRCRAPRNRAAFGTAGSAGAAAADGAARPLLPWAIARAALDGSQPVPAGEGTISRIHIRMLLGQAELRGADLDMMAVQLTAALEGPFLLYLTASPQEEPTDHIDRMAHAWQDLVERLCRP
ncbi:hypothetical protein Sxan_00920 [Streptomyces xanthophaeus]|uniref:Uncharacterized protein n=1 Tax=Streptomyces xanthophaeus TaxID=67385 RepID=A0A919L9F2_9ACTN|nr:hypothetical protein Sxan_00920 [Streptomyces xanthophaeus]